MSDVKSIRKCDVKVTAEELGVKVGDRFVVLSPENSFEGEKYYSGDEYIVKVGDVLTFIYDDNTPVPKFCNERTSEKYYESFACLARYEEKQEPVEYTIGEKITTVTNAHFNDVESTGTYSTFEIKGLTAKQFNDVLTFINNI